ncbi:MAG TPA: pirin family protein [Polyangiaceae bacterium]
MRRVLPSARRRMVGPFIFVDHIGPLGMAPGVGLDVRPHPHIGLATVTYRLPSPDGPPDRTHANASGGRRRASAHRSGERVFAPRGAAQD